ncbi:hypothetical protein KUTeg_007522 [Tegillarca granosa]|uniref:Cupin-like domain-containing protein n=1 Tax=Tegillarca granosa TaxID=220873 RepID=A0ABQ9FHI9_TEGGR|nr:hypothetical protein KUTeg_007522 [Tegillarca granosa]
MKRSSLNIIHNVDIQTFHDDIYPKRKPVILRGLDVGPCLEKWKSLEYLVEKGGKKPTKIHVSTSPQMDFINKNFVYRSLPFGEYVQRAAEELHAEFFLSEDEKYYLRALGDDPRKDIADIHVQFPELAKDIKFPELFDKDKFFSSVFRIASKGLQLWTHYDIMDNILIQVSGKKQVVLFRPSDADKMYLNAMWFHNVISLDFGIAVNVFWKHLADDLYDHKDTYGNKDLLPASRAMQIVDRALKTLEELPEEYREFYGQRLIAKIKKKTALSEKSDVT